MQNEKVQKIQCEMKTDLNLLFECLMYQMDQPASQKETLLTICSICQQNGDASDYFREIGGLLFVHNLVKSEVNRSVKEAALFTLGGLADSNVFCQQLLCTSELFEDLLVFLTNKDSSVNLKRMSVYVLLILASNNKSGQTCVRESGCLDVLLQLFRTVLSECDVNLLDQNMNQYYHLWSSVCSTLSACVNNPQNEENQKTCSLAFPHAKDWLQSYTKPEIVRPICSFIGLTVANNPKIQQFFVSIGGLAMLCELLVKLIHNSSGNYSSIKLAIVVTKTLDACIADNYAVGDILSRYNAVPNLLALLSYNILDSSEKFSIILTLGHCTDGCEENQYALVKNNGLPRMIQALTESQDEELNKAATFVLQNCKKITEKLSLKLTEHSLHVDDARQLEVDLQRRKGTLENYWDKAKEILCRIKQLENDHQEDMCSSVQIVEPKRICQNQSPVNKVLRCLQLEEKYPQRNMPEMLSGNSNERRRNEDDKMHQDAEIRRRLSSVPSQQNYNNPARRFNEEVVRSPIFIDDIAQEEIVQATANQTSGQNFVKSVTCTKVSQPPLKATSDEKTASKYENGSNTSKPIKPANKDLRAAPVSQSECSTLHSADKTETITIGRGPVVASKSCASEANKCVQVSQFLLKRPVLSDDCATQQVQNTEPSRLCAGITNRRIGNIETMSIAPKTSELRCSGCITLDLSLNSRNFSKILQSSQYLCEQHRVILETEMKYKRKLKQSIASSQHTSTYYNVSSESKKANNEFFKTTDLQTKQGVDLEKQSINQQYNVQDQGLSADHTYSIDKDNNTEIHSVGAPLAAFQKSKRRTRKDFTSKEISYLLDGVKKKGHHWNSILWAYPFQQGRTNVDLAKKFSKLQKHEKNRVI